MRILICGGRDYSFYAFDERLTPYETLATHVITGGAKGADTSGDEWAEVHNIPRTIYPALWYKHGKSAGFIRNQQMLTEGKPDLVIAFPGGKGTANMVKLAEEAGVKVLKFENSN